MFATDMQGAMSKFSEQINAKDKQSKFANSGVRLEAFSMKDEVRGGIMTKDGVYRLTRERDQEFELAEDDQLYEKEDDAWLRSIDQQRRKDGTIN